MADDTARGQIPEADETTLPTRGEEIPRGRESDRLESGSPVCDKSPSIVHCEAIASSILVVMVISPDAATSRPCVVHRVGVDNPP